MVLRSRGSTGRSFCHCCCCHHCFPADQHGRTSAPSAPLLPPSECQWLRVVLQPHHCQVGAHNCLDSACERVRSFLLPVDVSDVLCKWNVKGSKQTKGDRWKNTELLRICAKNVWSVCSASFDHRVPRKCCDVVAVQMGKSFPVF